MKAERLSPGPGPLAVGDVVQIRMENPTKIKISSLIDMRLKIKELKIHQHYSDPDPDDVQMQVKIDFIDNGVAEGDISKTWDVVHGGQNVTSTYTEDVEIVGGFERSVEVTHYEEIAEGDPDKYALFLFVKEAIYTEDNVRISDEEAWRLTTQREWIDRFSGSTLDKKQGDTPYGTFNVDFSVRKYFEYLKYLYSGKNLVSDYIIESWLPFAEKLVKIYKKLPPEEDKSWVEIMEDLANKYFDNEVDKKAFNINDYIPRKKTQTEAFIDQLIKFFEAPILLKVTGLTPEITNPLESWLGMLHRTIRYTYYLTTSELDAFEQIPGNEIYLTSPQQKLKFTNLLELCAKLGMYSSDPMLYLSKSETDGGRNALESYAYSDDSEMHDSLLELVSRINRVPTDVIDLYKEDPRDMATRALVEEKLKSTNVTVKDLDRFERYFKTQAVTKAFQMLLKNEKLVDEEIEKYEDQENLDAVTDIILSRKKEMRTASLQMTQALDDFRFFYPQSADKALKYYYESNMTESLEVVQKRIAAKYGLNWDRVVKIVFGFDRNYSDFDYFHLIGIENFIKEILMLMGKAMAVSEINPHLQDAIHPMTGFELLLMGAFVHYENGMLIMSTQDEMTGKMQAFMLKFFPGLSESGAMFDEAVQYYQGSAQYTRKDKSVVTFNILKDLTFNYVHLSQYKRSQVKTKITEGLAEKKSNIATVREYLIDDQDYIWEMGAVLEYTKEYSGILPDTNSDRLVNEHVEDMEAWKLWTSLGIGALSLVLAVGGFFTGGTTTAIGMALLTGSAIAGVADVFIEYNRLEFGKAVSNTALSEADELGKADVSYLGVVLAVAGVVLDVFQLVKAFNAFYKGVKVVSMTADDAASIFDNLAGGNKTIAGKFGKQITKDEFIKIFEEAAKKYGPDMAASKTFQAFVTVHEISPAARPGMFALMKADPDAFDLLKGISGFDKGALSNIGLHLTLEERLAGSVAETVNFFKGQKASTVKILNNYAGPGSKFIGNLSDIWKLINVSDAKAYPNLVEEILLDSRLQSRILEDSEMLPKLVTRWESWIKGGHKSKTFTDFVQTGSTAIRLDKPAGKTIAEAFAGDADKLRLFASPGMFREKNLTLLEMTEPALVKSLREGTFLPKNTELTKQIDEILDKDLIGTTTDVAYARSKVVSQINETIAKNVDIDELRAIRTAGTPGQTGSMGSIFNGWVSKHYTSIGGNYKLLGSQQFKGVQGQATTAKDIIFDNHYLPNDKTFVGVEFKSGDAALAGDDIEQAKRYGEMVTNPSLTKTTTNPAGYDNVSVEYIFLSKDAAEKSMINLQKWIPAKNLKVKYIDDAGLMKTL